MQISNYQTRETVDRISAGAVETFACERVGAACIICPGKQRDKVLKITWKANVPKLGKVKDEVTGAIVETASRLVFQAVLNAIFGTKRNLLYRAGSRNETEVVTFDTYHPVSIEGFEIFKQHRRRSTAIQGTFTFLTVVSCIALGAGAVCIMQGISTSDPDFKRLGWRVVVLALGAMVASLVAGRLFRPYGLPSDVLEKIGQAPIEIFAWEIVA